MKKSIFHFALFLVAVVLMAFVSRSNASQAGFNEKFAQTLKSAKAYTLEVAEKMPAEDYGFKPHDSVRSFGEQLAHIGLSTQFMHTMFIKGEKVDFDPVAAAQKEKSVGASKEEVIKHLNQTFDDAIEQLESMDDEELAQTFVFAFIPSKPELSKEEGYIFIRDHITHHRAQAIVSLRMKGHDAPQYRPF